MSNQLISPEIKKEIIFLESYDQALGIDISNMFEMIENQIMDACSKAENLPEENSKPIIQHIWYASTLLTQIKEKINDNFFVTLENLIYALKGEN